MLKLCALVLIALAFGGWHWASSAQAHVICWNYGSHVHRGTNPDQKWIFLANQDPNGNHKSGWFMDAVYYWNGPANDWRFHKYAWKWCGIPA